MYDTLYLNLLVHSQPLLITTCGNITDYWSNKNLVKNENFLLGWEVLPFLSLSDPVQRYHVNYCHFPFPSMASLISDESEFSITVTFVS